MLPDSEHWDLMLESGDALMTWQLLREPVDAAGLPIPAVRIGDHRKAYLDYEGPVSGDRGHVTRVDHGTCEFHEVSGGSVTMTLGGSRFKGRFALISEGDRWSLDSIP